jgi:hypothetical protein
MLKRWSKNGVAAVSLACLILVLVSMSAQAAVLGFKRTAEGRIMMSSADCSSLQAQVGPLKKWALSLGKKQDLHQELKCLELGELLVVGDGKFALDITDILPEFFQKQGFQVNPTSANCWSAVLHLKGILPVDLRAASDEEISFAMTSPLCKERPLTEPIEPGDIILQRFVHSREHKLIASDPRRDPYAPSEMHAFMYISDQLVFERGKPTMPYVLKEPFHFNSFENPKLNNPECERVIGHPPSDPEVFKKCSGMYQNVYTCKSMDEYLENKSLDHHLAQKLKESDALECRFADNSRGILSVSAFDSMAGSAKAMQEWAIKAEARLEKPEQPEKEEESFLLGVILLRAESIADALSRHQNGIFRTMDWVSNKAEGDLYGLSEQEKEAMSDPEYKAWLSRWEESKKNAGQ